jgi:hypothetical protein
MQGTTRRFCTRQLQLISGIVSALPLTNVCNVYSVTELHGHTAHRHLVIVSFPVNSKYWFRWAMWLQHRELVCAPFHFYMVKTKIKMRACNIGIWKDAGRIFLILLVGLKSRLGPLGTSATNCPIHPAPGDCEDGEFGGMKIGRENRSTWRKPAPAPICPPQIPLDQTQARTRAPAVGS